jgi:hypothetical protein
MKEIFVQFPTFEVVSVLDEDLSGKMGREFCSKGEQQRLVAILLALKDLDLITSFDRDHETWFFFDPKENLADDVLRIKLNKSKMLRSIELCKYIAPTLNKIWPGAVGSACQEVGAVQGDKFELDPFVSQLALWIDKEVITERQEFKVVDLAERMARICLELEEKGVTVRTSSEDISFWVTAPKIDKRIGGARVSQNERFTFSDGANAAVLGKFKMAVKVHLKRRLDSMLETEEAFFQLCNRGLMKIAQIDSGGHYLWDSTDKGRLADVN